MRPKIWPGLALAGGVVIAALIALLLIGSGGPRGGSLPSGTNPGDTRLFPGEVAGQAGPGRPVRVPGSPGIEPRGAVVGVGVAPGGSASEFEYDVGGNRGAVLSGP